MPNITIYAEGVLNTDIVDEDLQGLEQNWSIVIAVYELYLQYSLVCSSLTNFKKSMYARALDLNQMPLEQAFITSSSYIDAENSTMHMVSSLLKFTDLLPSLYSNCFPEDPDIYKSTEAGINKLYDEQNRKYMFLNELRNAIVHNKVSVTVSQGSDRKLIPTNTTLHIGYYIDLEKFSKKHIAKKHKREKLESARSYLCDRKGRVDLAKIFSEVISNIYTELVLPKLEELEQQLKIFSLKSKDYFVESKLIENSMFNGIEVEYEKRVLYSTSVLGRIYALSKSVSFPIRALCVSIAPSII
jgi:hypothetical protein